MMSQHPAVGLLVLLTLAGCAEPAQQFVPPPTIPVERPASLAPAPATTPSAAAVGQPVRDGKLTFTVDKVEAGPAEITSQFGSLRPLGRFVYVRVTVSNHAGESQMFVASAQKLLAGSVEYSANDKADLYLGDTTTAFQQVNPGLTVKGLIVYDIPKDVQPTGIRFHDSLWSGGATVTF